MVVRSVLAAGAAVFLGLALCAPGNSAHAQKIPGRPDAEAGAELAQKLCSNCHLTGTTTAPGARATADVPSFVEIAKAEGRTSQTITMAIIAPKHPMPVIALTRAEIDDLAAYILSLSAQN